MVESGPCMIVFCSCVWAIFELEWVCSIEWQIIGLELSRHFEFWTYIGFRPNERIKEQIFHYIFAVHLLLSFRNRCDAIGVQHFVDLFQGTSVEEILDCIQSLRNLNHQAEEERLQVQTSHLSAPQNRLKVEKAQLEDKNNKNNLSNAKDWVIINFFIFYDNCYILYSMIIILNI